MNESTTESDILHFSTVDTVAWATLRSHWLASPSEILRPVLTFKDLKTIIFIAWESSSWYSAAEILKAELHHLKSHVLDLNIVNITICVTRLDGSLSEHYNCRWHCLEPHIKVTAIWTVLLEMLSSEQHHWRCSCFKPMLML